MSLDQRNSSDNSGNNSSNNAGKNTNMSNNPLLALLGQQNLISSTNNIAEVNEVMKSLEETIKTLNKNTASDIQKLTLPKEVRTITSDISPNLPGLTLHTVIGTAVYVQPVLFYKVGITEVTESIHLANEPAARAIAKPAAGFMDPQLLEKIKTQYTYVDGKNASKVIILAPIVRNLEPYIKNQISADNMVIDVSNSILKEWSTSLYNIAALEATVAGVEFPNPFKDGKLFGKDDTAVARIEAVNKLIIDGVPTPYNLAAKISTTNKGGTQSANSSQSRSVATAHMTVSLEAMSQSQFQQARARQPGMNVGPLVPVVSTGLTVPGETLNNNSSMLTALLGLYASIGANHISYLSEAFRGKEVGHRGNIGNFNHYLSQIVQAVGGQFTTAQYITEKNITNAQIVNNWLGTYIAPQAVYVLDLATFTRDVANSDFWWSLVGKPAGSTYHRALITMLDALSNGKFSELAQANGNKGQNRNPRTEWTFGDDILKQTNIILPSGIAQGKDGKWFDLAEVDGMFLRQDAYYGQNESAINEYQALINGSMGGDNVKIRQYSIYNRLNQLFGANVILDGWNRRFLWENSFFATFAQAMATAGTLSLSGTTTATMWSMNTGNDYLNHAITAQITQSVQAAGFGGFNGMYSQY
jgi:hypothetical protein